MLLKWYFDFISPFAYLQHCQFSRLPDSVDIEYKPILFAGLLNHWQNVGPAEIPPKRIFTYKHCYWRAKKLGIPFKMPPAHPFNSLNALRLAIATGNQKDNIQAIFETIWRFGFDNNSPEFISHMEEHLELKNIQALTAQQAVKDQLRSNTEQAIEDNVFGVPTFVIDTQQFWGLDAFDMLLDYIDDPVAFNGAEMKQIETLPEGVQRKR